MTHGAVLLSVFSRGVGHITHKLPSRSASLIVPWFGHVLDTPSSNRSAEIVSANSCVKAVAVLLTSLHLKLSPARRGSVNLVMTLGVDRFTSRVTCSWFGRAFDEHLGHFCGGMCVDRQFYGWGYSLRRASECGNQPLLFVPKLL